MDDHSISTNFQVQLKTIPLTKPALFRTWIRQQILNSYQNPGVIRILCFVVVLQNQLLHDSATLRSKVSTWWECKLLSLESKIDLAEPAPKLNWIECFRLRQFRLGDFVRFLPRHKRNIFIIIRSRVILFVFLRASGLSLHNNHFRDFLFALEGSVHLWNSRFFLRGEDLRIWGDLGFRCRWLCPDSNCLSGNFACLYVEISLWKPNRYC